MYGCVIHINKLCEILPNLNHKTMFNFLKSKYTVVFEVIMFISFIIWFCDEYAYEPFIGIIGSLSMLITSIKLIIQEQKKSVTENEKILSKNFLYDYIPGEVGISKIIEEFGQPNTKIKDSIITNGLESNELEFYVYEYKFSNAIVLFATDIELENVISISVVSNSTDNNSINCRYSFSEDDEIFGEAEFKKTILENLVEFEHNLYPTWSYSAITSRYVDYRPIKYLYFTYINYNYYDEADDLYLEKIESICISNSSFIHPVIHFYKILFN